LTDGVRNTETAKADLMGDQPIYMLNALWFDPDGGSERYKEYLKAAAPIVARFGGKKLESYLPEQALIGEFDADLLFVVEWPSWETFQAFINDSEFQATRQLREEAITKSLLIRCRRAG
jgi:uncharacterized protein (DUF1330 family)